MSILIAIIIFSTIVLFHEFGHFLLAKLNHIHVVEFSLGMGPRLLSHSFGETRYSLKLFPFGGSCAMEGEDMDEDTPGSFNAASPLGRFAVIAAGPVFNFILAFVLALVITGILGYDRAVVTDVSLDSNAQAAGLQVGDEIVAFDGHTVAFSKELSLLTYLYPVSDEDEIRLIVKRDGKKLKITFGLDVLTRYLMGMNLDTNREEMVVDSVMEGYPMEAAGLQSGDEILTLNGEDIHLRADYSVYVSEHPLTEQAYTVTYKRDGEILETTVVPMPSAYTSAGFTYNSAYEKESIGKILLYSGKNVTYMIRTTFLSLKELVIGHFGVKDLSGPVGIVDAIGETYEESRQDGALYVWLNMINMALMLSANLGVMNLLPLPALDGGRLVFILVELIRRKPVNPEIEGRVHLIGLMLLLVLMVVVMYNDIMKIFF